jgi:GNAT superfamily N-acetyltransferase
VKEGKIGGAEGDRTLDLRIANATLSQLSYRPTNEGPDCNEAPPDQQAKGLWVRDDGPGNRVPFRLMKIRDATPADLEFIVAANTALAAETEGQTLDPTLLRAGVQAVLENPSLGRYYMAERNGQLLGQLMTTFEWSDWRNGLFLWVQSVYVMPANRGEGVFRTLFDHLATVAREDSRVCGIRLYVDRGNEKAKAVYGRLGLHRSNYGVMEVVYRGPESREVALKC